MRTTNSRIELLWHRITGVCLAACIAWALLLTSCDHDKPEPPKPGKVCTWDVPDGEKYGFQDAPGGLDSVDFIARAYEATHDLDCKTFDDHPHPLVILAHGRIAADVPYNYQGMTFLTKHLASWGDIVVTVNLDVVNSLQGEEMQWGIPHRGELILHTIEYMLAENRRPGSRFFQRIDSTKIGLVGHSRGGGAVIYAANYNDTHRNRPIKAIATLSPANFGTEPLQAPVPHICLYGTWDGDLFDGEGPRIWSAGTRAAPREMVEIYGANHYFFTDHATFPAEEAEIPRSAHHLLAKGMVNAWFDRYLRGQDRYDWTDYLMGEKRFSPKLEYYVSYQDADYHSIYTDPAPSVADGFAPGARLAPTLKIAPVSSCDFCDVAMQDAPDYCEGRAVRASWDARADGVSFHFPALDASPFAYLCFRASQVHGDSLNVVDQRKDFHVEVTDAKGGKAKVPMVKYINGLQYPDLSGSLPPDDFNNRKQLMRGFRIPKSDFAGVDFSQVTNITILFDRPRNKGFDNRSGAIKVTDLEFSN
jgi:hypothetical protein